MFKYSCYFKITVIKTSTSTLLTTPKPLTVCITTNCGEFFKMGIPDHLTCLLRNLYAGQEATVRTGHGTMVWLQIGKEVHQGCIWSPCLFNLYTEYIMRNARLDEAQAGIKTHIHRVGYAIQSSHPLSSPSPPAPNPSQHQSLFQ